MAIEETIEQKGQEAVFALGKGGGKLVLKVSKAVALWLLAHGWQLTYGKFKEHRESGRISEKKLQAKGGDVHVVTLPRESLHALSKHLRKAGVDFAVQKADNDQFHLLFQGKDADHLDFLVKKAFKQAGIDPDSIEYGQPEGFDKKLDTDHQHSQTTPDSTAATAVRDADSVDQAADGTVADHQPTITVYVHEGTDGKPYATLDPPDAGMRQTGVHTCEMALPAGYEVQSHLGETRLVNTREPSEGPVGFMPAITDNGHGYTACLRDEHGDYTVTIELKDTPQPAQATPDPALKQGSDMARPAAAKDAPARARTTAGETRQGQGQSRKGRKELLDKFKKESSRNLDQAHKARSQSRAARPQRPTSGHKTSR